MQVIEDLDSISSLDEDTVLTFGTFDGVHIGHRAIIAETVNQSRVLNLKNIVLSFDPHPMSFLSPKECPPLLTTTAKKLELLQERDVDIVILAKLRLHISNMSPEDFVTRLVVRRLRARCLVVGYDCKFGRARKGNAVLLQKLGDKYHFTVKIINPQKVGNIVVNSTRIRKAIAQDDFHLARQLLGRIYSISGRVIQGQGIGRQIGYPTANINAGNQMLPSDGIYAIRAIVNNQMFDGVLSMGIRPTFKDNLFQIEAHLFNFIDCIYGQTIEILFIEKIRDEQAFSSIAELRVQIECDIAKAKEILARNR